MLKVSFSLVVGNLVYFFTFPAFLTNLTPRPFALPSPEEVSVQQEEGCLLLSRGSLISWTWRSIELALLCR